MNKRDREVPAERRADIGCSPFQSRAEAGFFWTCRRAPLSLALLGPLYLSWARIGGTFANGQEDIPHAPLEASFRALLYPECHSGFSAIGTISDDGLGAGGPPKS